MHPAPNIAEDQKKGALSSFYINLFCMAQTYGEKIVIHERGVTFFILDQYLKTNKSEWDSKNLLTSYF